MARRNFEPPPHAPIRLVSAESKKVRAVPNTPKKVRRAPAASTPVRLVPAVERATRVLDALATAERPLSLAELARTLALPRSSLHGLLATLVQLDLARRDTDACFRPGARPVRWASAWNGQAEVVESFQRQARTLAALESETIMLAALDGTEVVYLACRPGQRALEINFRVGGRLPAAIASSGKAILAGLTDAQVRQRLAGHAFERITRHSVASLNALLRQLRTIRQAGHAVDDEEAAEGMLCLGAAVPARADQASMAGGQHAVAVSVIKAGLTTRRRRELEQAVQRLATAISQDLNPADAAGAPAPVRG